MEKIPLHLLQALVAFAETDHVSKAAIRLDISQPAISRQLKQLEDYLPHPLFTPKGRRKILTAYGRDLYTRIKGKLDHFEDLILETNNKHHSVENATIRISGRSEILERIISRIHFSGNLIFQALSGESVVDDLLDHKTDIGISTKKPDSPEIFFKTFFEDQFQLLIPKQSKSNATLSKAFLQNLEKSHYLSYESTNSLKKKLFSHFDCTIQNPSFRTFQNWKCLISLAEEGKGWTICPTSFIYNEKKCTSIEIPTKILPRNTFYLLYSKENKSVPWFPALIEEIRENISLAPMRTS